jgi:hypothetical protein
VSAHLFHFDLEDIFPWLIFRGKSRGKNRKIARKKSENRAEKIGKSRGKDRKIARKKIGKSRGKLHETICCLG